ncbi:MAG TPA: alcohol dehydrogenase catalytic domain-containing protein [Bryobacteraceae bacterium]|nr:alcohol dehydrogenase catalytic domain-containing protein [Bryobacteraceae bacterium]
MDTDGAKPSRRGWLKKGIAAAAGGATIAAQSGALFAQARNAAPGRKFRAWISRGAGPRRTTLQDVTLRPISGRQVVVRTEATNLCYSNTTDVLGLPPMNFNPPRGANPPAAPPPVPPAFLALQNMALIQGHGGVGIVEAVGPEVRRVQVGDRVCVSGTPQCGSCYQCLRGRADMCQFLGRQGPNDLVPIADLRDGTPVYANSHIGGLAELMVTFEEWVVPVFTKAPAAQLGMVCSCVSVAGLGCTTSQVLALVEPGSIVAVVGCGPLGLSAIQGARISGASRIIAVEPIRARRELALKVGATHVLDPNAEGDKLVDKVRELSSAPGPRLWAGGRDSGGILAGAGPDFVVEAVGADRAKPKLEPGPDPTGILPMRQAYEMCAPGGHIITTSLPSGNITLPAVLFAIGGRTHHAGQAGGANPMRDIPRFVEMLDRGQYDATSLATTVVPIERMMEAYQEVVDRTTVTAIMTG